MVSIAMSMALSDSKNDFAAQMVDCVSLQQDAIATQFRNPCQGRDHDAKRAEIGDHKRNTHGARLSRSPRREKQTRLGGGFVG